MRTVFAATMILSLVLPGCLPATRPAGKEETMKSNESAILEAEKTLRRFIEDHVAKLAPLELENNRAFWDSSITGDQKAYKKAGEMELAIRQLYSDKKAFAYLEKTRKEGLIRDPLLQRQLEILFLDFSENQIEAELLKKTVDLETEVKKIFNTFRGNVDGKQVTDNEIYTILKSSRDTKKRKAAWEAYKARGALVHEKVIELARLRNQAAHSLGYANFYEMRLKLIEQEPSEIKKIFDDLAAQTDEPFAKLMEKVNQVLAKRYGIEPGELRPWHYEDPFFQEGPAVGQVDLDAFFQKVDQKAIVGDFFAGIGLDPADILERSDLYEKEGKMPHAFCIDMDRKGDVRILANLKPSEIKTATLLHEMGHAVYDKYIDPELPWLLRQPSHSFATEAVAMLFGRLTRNPGWLEKVLGLEADKLGSLAEDVRFQQRLNLLVMARWTMVVVHFERELYANPEQDLNKLWWDLKKRYQLLTPPQGRNAPDWASKIHIAAWPAYYHNYMLGEMMASQLHYHLARQVLHTPEEKLDYARQTRIGQYLKEKIFAVGKKLRWDRLLVDATGETLNPKHFVDQFVR